MVTTKKNTYIKDIHKEKRKESKWKQRNKKGRQQEREKGQNMEKNKRA